MADVATAKTWLDYVATFASAGTAIAALAVMWSSFRQAAAAEASAKAARESAREQARAA